MSGYRCDSSGKASHAFRLVDEPNNEYCRVRLDRALALADWCARFPFAKVTHLFAVKSDHSPILLMNELEASNHRITIERPYGYEIMWERHEDF